MKSVIIAAVAALFVLALPVQAAEKPAAPAAKIAAADDACKKALEDCKKGGKSEEDCKADASVQAACPKN
jgi:type VI protein secretion system component VasF